jgi:hydrogenase-1 operon protein HyaE
MTDHPLVHRLATLPGALALDLAALDAFAARPGEHVLFLGGDPVRFPEALDVAVVLPELRAACAGRFDIGVVGRADEDAVARRFGVQRWPSLVLVRAGAYVATISGMQDWADYLDAMRRALDAPATRVPGVGIPVRREGAPDPCH